VGASDVSGIAEFAALEDQCHVLCNLLNAQGARISDRGARYFR